MGIKVPKGRPAPKPEPEEGMVEKVVKGARKVVRSIGSDLRVPKGGR